MLSLLTLSYSSAYPEFPEFMESLTSERSEKVGGIEWIRSRACAGAGQERKRTRVKPLLDRAFRGMDAGEIRKSLTVLPIRKSGHIGDAMCSLLRLPSTGKPRIFPENQCMAPLRATTRGDPL